MESADSVTKSYIRKALEDQKILIRKIILTGSTEKSAGYASNMTFATVKATTEGGTEKNIELAVKVSKLDFMEMYGKFYAREAYLYKTIFPEFSQFQKENNLRNIFDSVPKCYITVCEENVVVIVMENLRKIGYSLYDRKKPLNLDHLRLVLREYGKFHATSFALRDKRKHDFENLVANLDDVSLLLFSDSFREAVNHRMKQVCNILKETGETELYAMYSKMNEKGIVTIAIEAMKSIEPETVVLHGDCWNNNFLYKYENDDKFPCKVAVVDWQVSRLHSPTMDLSYFIYTNCSEEQLKHFDELLDVYYNSFSKFLTEMECDSTELFPYFVLLKHWKKYSIYGLVMAITFLHIIICDEEDAPEMNDNKDGKALAEGIMNVPIRNDIEYRKRLIAILRHYYEHNC